MGVQTGDQKTLLMGIGGAGMNITRCVAEHIDYPVVAVTMDARALAAWDCSETVLLGEALCGGMPAKLPAVAVWSCINLTGNCA